ncbi:MAG: muconolactone Delta-isomerase family protein [Bacteroidota bacterium]
MYKQYMVEFDLPDPFPADFMARIPEQRNVINYLLAEGKIKSYSLSMDRSKLWSVFVAESEFEVLEMIAQWPVAEWLTPEIEELMFHNSSDMVLQFSLN